MDNCSEKDLFISWLEEFLESLGLDGPTYAVYVSGIMEEEEGDVVQKSNDVCELLSGATDNNLEDFREQLVKHWNLKEHELAANIRAKEESRVEALLANREQELFELVQVEKNKSNLSERSEISKLQRDRILMEYGYHEDFVDEEGNLMEMPRDDVGEEIGLEPNTNKKHVMEIAKAKREAAKAAHEAKIARDKEQQAKEKAKKEMAKVKSVKQERKGGKR